MAVDFLAPNLGIQGLVQTNTIARAMDPKLFPALMWRAGVARKRFELGVGQTINTPVPGLLPVIDTPRGAGVPVTPTSKLDFEFYSTKVEKYGVPTEPIDMPSDAIAVASIFREYMTATAEQAARTMNRLCRNPYFLAYGRGHAMVDSQPSATTIRVSSLSGFSTTKDLQSGLDVPVSSANPRTFFVNGTIAPVQIIGAVPDAATNPFGPGTLTLSGALAVAANDRIVTSDRSAIIRSGNVKNVDGITAGNRLTTDDISNAVAILTDNFVPPMEDGTYHVHLDAFAELDITKANGYQRQIEGRGLDDDPYLKNAIGRALGCTFFRNPDTPNVGSVNQSKLVSSRPNGASAAMVAGDCGVEVVNAAGVPIGQTMVIGGGALIERFLPENAYMTEAGYAGKVGGGQLTKDGLEIPMDGIRMIAKAPTDIYGEQVQFAWSYTGAFVTPSNQLTGNPNNPATYKRGVLIQHASTGGTVYAA